MATLGSSSASDPVPGPAGEQRLHAEERVRRAGDRDRGLGDVEERAIEARIPLPASRSAGRRAAPVSIAGTGP